MISFTPRTKMFLAMEKSGKNMYDGEYSEKRREAKRKARINAKKSRKKNRVKR